MDGVVIDSEPLYEKIQQDGLASYGINLSEGDFLRFKGLSEEAVFDSLESDYGVTWDRDQVQIESRNALLAEFRENLNYMTGFPEIMGRIPAGFTTGLVTSTKKSVLNEVDLIKPVKQYFREIVAGGDTEQSKPHPAPYLEMLRRLNVKPEDAIVLEDSVNGVRSGKAAGAKVIALSATYQCGDLSEADICVKALDEITPVMISNLAGRQ